jgi:hypothetical protein
MMNWRGVAAPQKGVLLFDAAQNRIIVPLRSSFYNSRPRAHPGHGHFGLISRRSLYFSLRRALGRHHLYTERRRVKKPRDNERAEQETKLSAAL